MAEKRRISIRKILQMVTTLVVTIGCIFAITAASNIQERKLLKSVSIHIKNSKKYHFIEQNEVMEKAINNRGINVMNTSIGSLDLMSMEQVLRTDPWIADAQVYIDNDYILNIFVTQRVPVVRLFTQNSGSIYMDATLSIMPLSKNYIYYTTVVTNVPELKNDSASLVLKQQIYSLVKTIQADTFWNTQISQIIVDSGGTFDFIPMLGNQTILFGDTTDMKAKFTNLFAFYKKALNRIGWDKYDTLDLRYKNEIIASPQLPYNDPGSNLKPELNWINAILETYAKNSDTTETAENEIQQEATVAPKEVVKDKPKDKIEKHSISKNKKITKKDEKKGKHLKETKETEKRVKKKTDIKGRKPG